MDTLSSGSWQLLLKWFTCLFNLIYRLTACSFVLFAHLNVENSLIWSQSTLGGKPFGEQRARPQRVRRPKKRLSFVYMSYIIESNA